MAAAQAPQPRHALRACSLLGVLLVAKGLTLAGARAPVSLWSFPAYIWQDVLLALIFFALDATLRRPAILWAIYGVLVVYAAINVPITWVLSTPLTWTILRAARGPLADSYVHSVTPVNLMGLLLPVAVGVGLPWVLSRRVVVLGRGTLFAALAVVIAGIAATGRTDTRGLHRNAVGALVATSLPRVAAAPGDVVDWRISPFPDPGEYRSLDCPSIGSASPGPPARSTRGDPCAPLRSARGGSTGENLKAFKNVAAGRNVVLVILESTAARHLGVYGAKWDPMPSLTALSRQAIVFDRAYAVYPESIKELFATLCSQYPAFDTAPELYAAAPCGSLPRRLKEAGYRTALFHSGRFGYLGMRSIIDDRGFDVLEDAGAIGGVVNSSFGVDDRSTAERVLGWIDSLDPGRRFFVTYEPIGGHHPYATAAPGPLEGNDDQTRYLNALRESDEALGRLLRGLRERHLDEQTVFVVFGDHGEAFGEHPGNFAHTLFIYEENVHVPLVVAVPGAIREEVRVSRPASIIDIAPTILSLLGLPADPGHQGSSLLEPQPRMSLFFTDYSIGWLGLVDGCWKYLYEMDGRRSRLFDVCADPRETRDRSPEFPERVSAYRERVQQWAAAQKERIGRGR